MKKTAVCVLVFFLVAMSSILAVSAGREEEPRRDEQETSAEEPAQAGPVLDEAKENGLSFAQGRADTGYLRIPLPAGCGAQELVIENFYMDRELRIFVPGAKEDFYSQNALSGNCGEIQRGSFDMAEGGAVLDFQLTGVYECRTILEDENLYIRFLPPPQVYDRIVVIDPAWGGEETGNEAQGLVEKDINLAIATSLGKKLEEGNIKAYYTRMDDVNPSAGQRTALGNAAGADMYIRIQLGAREDPAVYGVEASYRTEYFIPGFGSRELAELLEREVAAAVNGKAMGTTELEGEETLLFGLEIPAASVTAGYITNKQEALLLGRQEYIDKIAEGIYQAVLKAYENDIFR